MVVELQNVWRMKFGDLVNFAKFSNVSSRQTFVLYDMLAKVVRD